MSGKFMEGTRIGTMLNREAEVVRWLAEGGQGDVYVVKYNGEEKALKWYKPNGMGNDKEAFRKNLEHNARNGAPSKEFLWPLDVTDEIDGSFGYIMNLRPEGYYELSDFLRTNVRFASFRVAADTAIHIASGFRRLHNNGYSYQDLNDGNFFINPQTGDVLICDNDNVAPDGVHTGILGKPRYMAPEIVRGDKMPNSESDLFSMSVIIFLILFLDHPLEGKRSCGVMTAEQQKKLYGTDPLFIMDKDNHDNAPVPGDNVLKLWSEMPDYMRELFSKAFCHEALMKPGKRPIDLDWMKNLVRFRSCIIPCSCGNDTFSRYAGSFTCDGCGKQVTVPYRLELPDYSMPAIRGNKIYRCQMGGRDAKNALDVVGEILAKKTDPSVLALRNCGAQFWKATASAGEQVQVMPGQVMGITGGLKVYVTETGKNVEIKIAENR